MRIPEGSRWGVVAIVAVIAWAVASPVAASCRVCRGSGCWFPTPFEYGKQQCFIVNGVCRLAGSVCGVDGGGDDDGGIDEQDWLSPARCQSFAMSGAKRQTLKAQPTRSAPPTAEATAPTDAPPQPPSPTP